MAFTKIGTRKSLAVCAIEATYGADPSLTPATQGFLTYESPASWEPIVDFDTTQVHSSSRTQRLHTPGKYRVRRQIKFWLQGGSAAGTADPQSPMLECCGVTKTNSPGVSNTYKASAIASEKSAKLGVEHDGMLVETPGLFGTFVMDATLQRPLTVSFDGRGLWRAKTFGNYGTWAGGAKRAKPFLAVSMVATVASESLTFVGNSFRFDRGIQIQDLDDFNAATGIQQTYLDEAEPTVTIVWAINTTPGGTDLSYIDFETELLAQTTQSLAFTIAGAAGNNIAFTFPELQIKQTRPVDIRGVLHCETTYLCQSATDQNEFQWVIT